MAAGKNGLCSQCGATVQYGARVCPWCGVPYWDVEPTQNQDRAKPEPKPESRYGLEAIDYGEDIDGIDDTRIKELRRVVNGVIQPATFHMDNSGQVNFHDGNVAIMSYTAMNAIRAVQNQQTDCNTMEWIRRQAAQAQNAIPYTPAPRPVCKELERKRKPFENDAPGLAMFIFLLILAVICFGMAVLSLFAEFVGVNPLFGKSVLFLLFSGMGLVPASFAKTMWKGEFP